MGTEFSPEIAVFVRLLEEGTDVWRPTKAIAVENGLYHLLPTKDYDTADEIWEFPPGSFVALEERSGAQGTCLVAKESSK